MAWRAAASLISLAILFLSMMRTTASVARNRLRVLGAAVVACILTVTAIGAFNLSVAFALAASDLIS